MDVLREVMLKYPQRAATVKVLEKPHNEGVPAARRNGLELAEGEYVIHCDSDDRMEPDMLETMYREARLHDADGVVCGWMRGDIPAHTKYTRTGENLRDFILEDIVAVGEMQALWRYMFKRDVYSRGVEFPLYNQGEDQTLLVELAYHSKSIYCVTKPLYHWLYYPESITHADSVSAARRRFEEACANACRVESFLAGKGMKERYASGLVALKLNAMFFMRPLLREGAGIGEWRKAFPEIKGKVLCNKSITFTHQIEYLMNRYCPPRVIEAIYRLRRRHRRA